MNTPSYLKNLSIPKFDDVLAYSGLQRSQSILTRVLAGAGLISLGAILGAGLSFWFGSPKNRKQVTTAFTHGLDKVTSMVSNGHDAAADKHPPAAARVVR